MKILHIHLTTGYFNDTMAYQENMLIKYHKILGHEVTLITGPYELIENRVVYVGKKQYINDDGVRVIRLQIVKGQTNRTKLKKYKDVLYNIQKCAPDVIFSHGCQFVDILDIKKYAKKNRNVKIYVDNHADYSNSATTWVSRNILHKIIWRYFAKQIEPYTQKIYGVLPARVDFLIELYGLSQNKCELLVMGADDKLVSMAFQEDVKRNVRKKYNIDVADFLIVTGGKIDQWKKQTVLLEKAVNRMKRKNVKLLIFGSVIPELKEQIMSLCNENIKYIGWLSVEDSYKVIGAADLAVYPGRHSTLWEQTAGQGIPMVVKHWEGTHHVDMGGNVKFLYRDSVKEICDTLEELLDGTQKFVTMRRVAKECCKYFLYSTIAKESIEDCGNKSVKKI